MNTNHQYIKNMEIIANKMYGKNEEEVIDELAEFIGSGQLGLTPKRTMEMIASIEPMLDNEQKKKLTKLYNKLKKY